LPTPALALAAMTESASAIMVTGSHIPDDRNGLKFYTLAGEITKADEAGILAAAGSKINTPTPNPSPQGGGGFARHSYQVPLSLEGRG
jgi:phosphomannomutase